MVQTVAVRSFASDTPAYREAFRKFLDHTDQKANARRWLEGQIDALPARDVLIDAGAGTGELTAWLSPRFREVIAIEPNPSLVNDLMASCPAARVLPSRILDAAPPRRADFVLCSHVFYYIPHADWARHLHCFQEWVKPGGVVAVALQNPASDCMQMVRHFLGARFDLAELIPAAHAAGDNFRTEVVTVPARIRTGDLPTAVDIAEFVLNTLPIPPSLGRDALEDYVQSHFSRPDGTFVLSCDQDFLRVERVG